MNFGDDAYSRVKTLHDQLITSLESPGYDRLQVEISGGEENVRFELLGTFITEVDNEKQFSFMIPSDTYSSLDDAKSKLGEEINIEFISLLVGQRDEIIGLTGEDLERAYPGQHQQTNKPIINIEFNDQGTRKFAELTTEIAATSDKIAIFLTHNLLVFQTLYSKFSCCL